MTADKPVQKVAGYIPVSTEMLLDDYWYVQARPWLRPDPNPYPRIRLWRWLP